VTVTEFKYLNSVTVTDFPPRAGDTFAGAMSARREPPPSDPEQGVWQGRKVARRVVSPDGFTVLVGKTADDNDDLSLRICRPEDFWFHLAGDSGSHVVVRNPDRLDKLPRTTLELAAALAAGYSKARNAGRVAVHAARGADVSKRRGQPPGEVELARFKSVTVKPLRLD
jgi:predicted ribosome quality control (RQC) complex YloA/Tae2 family protein